MNVYEETLVEHMIRNAHHIKNAGFKPHPDAGGFVCVVDYAQNIIDEGLRILPANNSFKINYLRN